VVTVHKAVIEVDDLPPEFDVPCPDRAETASERRHTLADELYEIMIARKESFWTAVYSKYMAREITRADVRAIVRRGLEVSRGNYRIVARHFNLEASEYSRFMNFLRKHECHLPYREHRSHLRSTSV
jgi:hypothetical protein